MITRPAAGASHLLALDGIRGIAVLLVMAYHFRVPLMSGGGHTGVGLFFALSGYLITRGLLDEMRGRGRVDLRGFASRRARRLVPALAGLVVVLFILAAARGNASEAAWQSVVTMTFTANWALGSGMSLDGLTHAWTLGVEAQFYVAWPLVLIGAMRLDPRRGPMVAAILLAAGAMTLRLLRPELHVGIDRSDALMAGALVALVTSGGRRPRVGPAVVAIGAVLVTANAIAPFDDPLVRVWGLLGVAVGAGILVAASVSHAGRIGVLTAGPLVAAGRLSYGLYLWHVPVALLLAAPLAGAGLPWWLVAAALTIITVACAMTSYRYVERPFMRRRHAHHEPTRPEPAARLTTA